MSSPNDCKHRCTGCTQEIAEKPLRKIINGIPHLSTRPACHPACEQGAFERGGILETRLAISGEAGDE